VPFTYILKSLNTNNWHYVDSCRIIENRFKQHQKGSVKSTKSKRPLELIYFEEFETATEARKRELFLK